MTTPSVAVAASYTPTLTIEPSYSDTTTLTAATLEYSDALPTYSDGLTDVASGRQIGLEYGYAQTDEYSDLEGPYTVDTTTPLTAGRLYDFRLRVRTTGFWHCSIYDEDGCSWHKGESNSYTWRFKYNGGTMQGSPYTPRKVNSKLVLSKKQPWSKHGWKVKVTLKRGGEWYPAQELKGEYRTSGRSWRRDGIWKTDRRGRLVLSFRGEQDPTSYRFKYRGNGTTKGSTSAVFNIKARR